MMGHASAIDDEDSFGYFPMKPLVCNKNIMSR